MCAFPMPSKMKEDEWEEKGREGKGRRKEGGRAGKGDNVSMEMRKLISSQFIYKKANNLPDL